MDFVDVEPTLENYWRAIILFGKNTASYKFALAKSLIDISHQRHSDLITLEDLALPYALHLCEHLKDSPKQSTNKNVGKFIQACRDYNEHLISQQQLINVTTKEGFNYVLDAFHVVNNKAVKENFFDVISQEFFVDERRFNKGIRLTENLFHLFYDFDHVASNLSQETESRWHLVEKAWELGISRNLIGVEYDKISDLLFIKDEKYKRVNITSSRSALNGYQKGRCFYCARDISILPGSDELADVDHFFPHILKPDVAKVGCRRSVNIDGVWNLVLSCTECNRGESGKFARVPNVDLLNKLHIRNEYLIGSHHPLKETLIMQTGSSEAERKQFLQKSFNFSKEKLIHTWHPYQMGRADI